MTRRLRLPLVALTVAGVVVAAPAAAHDAAYSSHVTLSSEDNVVYKGNVSSSLRGCEKNRKVKLYMGMIGSGTYTGAFDFTNDEGHYKINTAPTIVPDYYTRAVRKVIERNGHTHTCRGATSNQL